MDAGFWHERWQLGEIGFHREQVHPFLPRFFPRLKLHQGARVLVPLCGKSLDMLWLAQQGFEVIGVELSRLAIEEFCRENSLQPQIDSVGELQRYRMAGLTLYCGDFFSLETKLLGPIDAVYDRAALVALPPVMRAAYADHLCRLLEPGGQLLAISFEYDQQQMSGPPFSVPQSEIDRLFSAFCLSEPLHSESTLDNHQQFKIAGLTEFIEEVYLLTIR